MAGGSEPPQVAPLSVIIVISMKYLAQGRAMSVFFGKHSIYHHTLSSMLPFSTKVVKAKVLYKYESGEAESQGERVPKDQIKMSHMQVSEFFGSSVQSKLLSVTICSHLYVIKP
jgi:hypothetical protein